METMNPNGSGCSLVYQGLANTKIRCISFHPSRCWLAVGDEKGFVSVHDYQNNLILHRIQPEAAVETKSGAGIKTTSVRLISFLDEEVAFWRVHTDPRLAESSFTTIRHPQLQAMHHKRLQRGTMVITVTVNSVLSVVFGTSSQEVRTIRGLEAKGLSAIETVILSHVRIICANKI